ncbi:glycosyl hydrolase family 76-domain-containing protein, partial [Pseudomassariella vexata]
ADSRLFSNFTTSLETWQSGFFPIEWVETNAWIAAFFGTMLSSSIRTISASLATNGTFSDSGKQHVVEYYDQVQQYFGIEPAVSLYTEGYDDVQWVVLGWLEALRALEDYKQHSGINLGQDDIEKYAHRAHVFYDRIMDKYETSLCGGGITWSPKFETYKNAITNELYIATSVGIYLYHPGDSDTSGIGTRPPLIPPLFSHDPELLQKAKIAYGWFMSQGFFNEEGLIIDGFHISPNQSTCDKRDTMVWSYNQGVILSAMRQLWEATGDDRYLNDGYALIGSTIKATGWLGSANLIDWTWRGLGRHGVMEDVCDSRDGCDRDPRTFKGIYFHHLKQFCEPLPTDNAAVPGVTYVAPKNLAASHTALCKGYQPWVEHNAQTALSTKDSAGIMGGWWNEKAWIVMRSEASKAAAPLPEGAVYSRNYREVNGSHHWSNEPSRGRRSPAGDSKEHSVETHMSGLSVVKAAWDL